MQITTVLFISFATTAVIATGKKHQGHDQDNVHYKFGYGVHDPHTHDEKSHHEERHGKYVTGHYSLKQPDGTTRVVHYKAGPHTGFEAVVEIIGHPHHHNDDHGHKGHEDKGHKEHKEDKEEHDHDGHGHGYAVHEDHQDLRYDGHQGYKDDEDEQEY